MHSSVRSEKNLQYIYVINLKDPFKKKILKQRPTKSKVRPVFPQNWGRKTPPSLWCSTCESERQDFLLSFF